MSAVGKHSGDPVEEIRVLTSPNRLLWLAAGVTATLIAWGYLVWQAIAFGNRARDGESLAWFFLLIATLGGVACLFAALVLGMKLLQEYRGQALPTAPAHGHHEAAAPVAVVAETAQAAPEPEPAPLSEPEPEPAPPPVGRSAARAAVPPPRAPVPGSVAPSLSQQARPAAHPPGKRAATLPSGTDEGPDPGTPGRRVAR
jgi:hypothetical protein